MSSETYQNAEKDSAPERQLNTDPREASANARPFQPPRQRPTLRWLLIGALLLVGLVGIFDLAAGHAIGTTRQLPTRTFTINGHGLLVINDESGTLHIHEGAGNQVIIQATERAYGLVSNFNDIQVQCAQQGNTVTVSASEDWNWLEFGSLTLDITVPSNLDVSIHGGSTDADVTGVSGQVTANLGSGDLRLNNIHGGLNLQDSSGDIVIDGAQGNVSAHASSGDIRASQLTGSADLSTSSGNITLSQFTGPANLETSSGDIVLDQAQLSGHDQIQTHSGDITFTGSLDPRGTYEMSTSSGDITLNLPVGSSFQLSASTSSGDVRNDFASTTTGQAPYAALTLQTSSGDIRIHQRQA